MPMGEARQLALSGAEGAGGAGPPSDLPAPSALVSAPEAAETLGRSIASLTGLALREPAALPVFVLPESPGWAVVPVGADPADDLVVHLPGGSDETPHRLGRIGLRDAARLRGRGRP